MKHAFRTLGFVGLLALSSVPARAGDSHSLGFLQTIVGRSEDVGGVGTLGRAAQNAEEKCMNYRKIYQPVWDRFQASNHAVVRPDDVQIDVKFTYSRKPAPAKNCREKAVYSSSTGASTTVVCEVPVECDVAIRTRGHAWIFDDFVRLPVGNRWSCGTEEFKRAPQYALALASMVRWEDHPHGTDGCYAYFQRFGTDLEKR